MDTVKLTDGYKYQMTDYAYADNGDTYRLWKDTQRSDESDYAVTKNDSHEIVDYTWDTLENWMKDNGLIKKENTNLEQTNLEYIQNMNAAELAGLLRQATECGRMTAQGISGRQCQGCSFPFCVDKNGNKNGSIENWLIRKDVTTWRNR